MAFCMRPAQGTVRASSTLNCELSFYPRFNVPSRGTFNLLVDGLKTDQVLGWSFFNPPLTHSEIARALDNTSSGRIIMFCWFTLFVII